MLEIIIWALTMLLTALTCNNLSNTIKSAEVDRLTISKHNADLLSRTFKSNALSYIIVGITLPIAALTSPIPQIEEILREWWVLEIFIFWNLRSAYLYHVAKKRFRYA